MALIAGEISCDADNRTAGCSPLEMEPDSTSRKPLFSTLKSVIDCLIWSYIWLNFFRPLPSFYFSGHAWSCIYLLLAATFWGCTNPFLRKGSQHTDRNVINIETKAASHLRMPSFIFRFVSVVQNWRVRLLFLHWTRENTFHESNGHGAVIKNESVELNCQLINRTVTVGWRNQSINQPTNQSTTG